MNCVISCGTRADRRGETPDVCLGSHRRHGAWWAALHCAAFSGYAPLRGKRRAGCLRASCPSSLNTTLRPDTLGVLPRAGVHTLRACGSEQSMQPPSPCRRGNSRSASRQQRRLTGLSAANDITRCYPQAPACPARRAAPAALKSPRPRNPRYVQLAASASMRLPRRRAPGAAAPGCPCALRFLRAIHGLPRHLEVRSLRAVTLIGFGQRPCRALLVGETGLDRAAESGCPRFCSRGPYRRSAHNAYRTPWPSV
jgi:hypothetical protein